MDFPVDPSKYAAFLVVMLAFAVSPGPAVVLCMRTGLAGRVSSVLAAVAGLNSGTLIWFIGAAVGLQVLLSRFPVLFHLMAFAGGLYLLWLAFQTFRASALETDSHFELKAKDSTESLWTVFRQGVAVQLLNPKALLFFVVALPPFLDLKRDAGPQFAVLAATTIGMDVVGMTTYGLAAVSLSRILKNPRNRQRFDRLIATILGLMALGILIGSGQDLMGDVRAALP